MFSEDARKIAGTDPDYGIRDLYGDFPNRTVSIQVLSLEDVNNASFDVFDVTKVLLLEKYPLRKLGRFVLNSNPTNYFAEFEQLAFGPGNQVPGILGAPDELIEARRLSYRPIRVPHTYNRDGRPPVDDNV